MDVDTRMSIEDIIPAVDDTVKPGQLCECEFTPYKNGDTSESWHFKRRCQKCGHAWYGLHCPHDGVQNSCPNCGTLPKVISETN